MSKARAGIVGLTLCLIAGALPAGEPAAPAISIIIDDLGNRLDRDLRAVTMPAALTLSFLPHSPYTSRLAMLAHSLGKDVMAHLPMQPIQPHALGHGGLRLAMSRRQFVRTVRRDILAVPHARGVNNHMGSLLTQHRGRMGWLMEELRGSRDLFFVDSYTTPWSVARDVAMQNGVPALKRDVFLDDDPEPLAMQREFDRLIALARADGTAVAIAHPYPQTLSFLETRLPGLADEGINLIPVSNMIRRARLGRPEAGGKVIAVKYRRSENNDHRWTGRRAAN